MKSRILGLLAMGLLAGPMAAVAVPVSITGQGPADGVWNVTTELCDRTQASCQAVLGAQVWFGSSSLATAFAVALWDDLGFLNFGYWGPFFAYSAQPYHLGVAIFDPSAPSVSGTWSGGRDTNYWAIASRIGVPEPGTLALLGLGLMGLGLTRRRAA